MKLRSSSESGVQLGKRKFIAPMATPRAKSGNEMRVPPTAPSSALFGWRSVRAPSTPTSDSEPARAPSASLMTVTPTPAMSFAVNAFDRDDVTCCRRTIRSRAARSFSRSSR